MVFRYSSEKKINSRKVWIIVAMGIFASILYACMSPLDPSTPRLRIVDRNPPLTDSKIHAKSITVTVRNKQGDTIWHSAILDTLVLIDTSASPPVLWLHMDVARTGEKPNVTPFMLSFWFKADSLVTNGSTISLVRDSMLTQLAGYVYSFSRYSTSDSANIKVNAAPNQATAYISFRTGTKNQLVGQFSGMILKYQLPVYAEILIEY
jgi:hypothetical protein